MDVAAVSRAVRSNISIDVYKRNAGGLRTAPGGGGVVGPRPCLLSSRLWLRQYDADAWVVVDDLVEGMAMGGTRMTTSVTEAELAELARAMTHKLALVDLPIGGAKAGIRPRGPVTDRAGLMRAFGRAAAPLLHGGVYLGCDLGTSY